jgi:hypothetical protein
MGKLKGDVITQLVRRFGFNNAVKIIQKSYTAISNYLDKKNLKNVCIMLDSIQEIESSRDAGSGLESYKEVRESIRKALSIRTVSRVVVTLDSNKCRNPAKDGVYFSFGGKRRLKKRPILFKKDQGRILINDSRIPTDDAWTGLKMGPESRKQINFYYPDKLSRELRIEKPDAWDYHFVKELVVDNCVRRKHLFGLSPNETPYTARLITYNRGAYVGTEETEASCISEGELTMPYFKDYPDCFNSQNIKFDASVFKGKDQDSIPIALFNYGVTKNIFLVIDKKKKKRDENGKPIEDDRGNHVWEYKYMIVDVKKMSLNMLRAYQGTGVPHPIASEMFLFFMAGCDFFDKPFPRVGYEKNIFEEYVSDIGKYGKMVREIKTKIRMAGSPDEEEEEVILVYVNLKRYREFAKKVYLRSAKNRHLARAKKPNLEKARKNGLKNFEKVDNRKLFVMPRQFMFHTVYLMNTHRISIKRSKKRKVQRLMNNGKEVPPNLCGECCMFDPYQTDKRGDPIWGYKLGNVKNCFVNPVCISSEVVSKKF